MFQLWCGLRIDILRYLLLHDKLCVVGYICSKDNLININWIEKF